jgi:hypothetical protein
MIFHVSMDSGTKYSETPKEREARLAKKMVTVNAVVTSKPLKT